jgi:hypothetical protein
MMFLDSDYILYFYPFKKSKLMINIFQKKYIRFAIIAIIYILVVIWIGNYWLLLGLGIIFDLYVTEKINWTFWKRRDGNNSSVIEWLDDAYKHLPVSELPYPNALYGKIVAGGRSSICKQAGIWSQDAKYTYSPSFYAAYNADNKRQIMVEPCTLAL